MSEEKKSIPKIKWHLEQRRIEDLEDYAHNPRIMSEAMMQELEKSIIEDGIIDKPYLNTDNIIIGGHQRKQAFINLGIEEVDCWLPHRDLTDKEVKRINLRGNKIDGEFDAEKLLDEFNEQELLDAGFSEQEVAAIFDEWDSTLGDAPTTAPEEPTTEIVKLEVKLGERAKIVGLLQQALKNEDVTIL